MKHGGFGREHDRVLSLLLLLLALVDVRVAGLLAWLRTGLILTLATCSPVWCRLLANAPLLLRRRDSLRILVRIWLLLAWVSRLTFLLSETRGVRRDRRVFCGLFRPNRLLLENCSDLLLQLKLRGTSLFNAGLRCEVIANFAHIVDLATATSLPQSGFRLQRRRRQHTRVRLRLKLEHFLRLYVQVRWRYARRVLLMRLRVLTVLLVGHVERLLVKLVRAALGQRRDNALALRLRRGLFRGYGT